MRKSALFLASICAFAAATPAEARNGAWYVGGDFGGMIVEDTNFDFQAASPPNTYGQITIDHDFGYDGSLFIGYDLGAFRLEAETSYKRAGAGDFTVDGATYPTPTGGITPGINDFSGGRTSALSFMINGMLDFGDDDGISGFVGGGVGVARVDFNNLRAFSNTKDILDDSDTRFAWQVVAGVRHAVSNNIDITLRYRFFNADNIRTVNWSDLPVDSGRFQSHSILGGITFNFGAPPPPPPPPPEHFQPASVEYTPPPPPPPPPARIAAPPPPPPPPPPAPAPVTTSFIVFFDWDSDVLTPQAKAVLDSAVSAYKQSGAAQINIAGHADSSGPADYNDALARRRALNVFSYMAARDVPTAAMDTRSFGETDQRVPTADGVREVQNRRVEINLGPGSGQ